MFASTAREGAVPSVGELRVSRTDSAGFALRLAVAAALTGAGAALALSGPLVLTVLGVLLLGAMFAHAVELQHQCLHHSAFRRSWPHRLVGVPLGLPMLVSYSHYRVRHLQHHRYLGTERDSEFFGFDTRRAGSVWYLLICLFDYARLYTVAKNVALSARGTWQYRDGQIAARARRRVIAEYRLFGLCVLAALALAAAGFGREVLLLWAAPLAVAVPIHFLVELPEHVFCDDGSTDVLRNTRTIAGSWLSTWYTNSNNLHVEHHVNMRIPMQRLPGEGGRLRGGATHVERSYWEFYTGLARQIRRIRREGPARRDRQGAAV